MAIATINPATGETLKTFDPLSAEQIEAKLQKAADTFKTYRRTTIAERAQMLHRAADILDNEKEQWGRLMTTEMGKTLKSAIEEAQKCAKICRYNADNAERILADEDVKTEATRSYVHFQPLGPILAVMPWNFPFLQVFRFAAPSLMAGNVGVLKHASNVPQSALAIEEIFRRASFPDGVFQTLLVGSDAIDKIVSDPRIKAATLTGSEPAGSMVASTAGKHIKKTVLELGGSDPFIVMPSASFEEAVTTAVKARNINNGQSCIAAKRFIVEESIADEFERRFIEGFKALKVGDPMDASTDVGPLATPQIRETLEQQIEQTVKAGGRILVGGKRREGAGNYYEPTILTDISEDSPAFQDEIFGPAALLFRVKNIDEAIRVANATTFGLGSSVWTNDPAERARFIDEIESGQVFVNAMVASDARIPFGGVKHSGYGRELGTFGMREFVNVKTVWCIDKGSKSQQSDTE